MEKTAILIANLFLNMELSHETGNDKSWEGGHT